MNIPNKGTLYKRLFEIEKDGVDISDMLCKLAQNQEEDVLEFINLNSHLNFPEFVNKLTGKKFYHTLIDRQASTNDRAKALSSLITHTLIEYSHGKTDLILLSKSVKLNEVLAGLKAYCIEGNSQIIDEISDKLRMLFIETKKSGGSGDI